VYGYGDFSSIFIIRASEVPDTMNTISSMQVLKYIVVAWTKPDDGGETIDKY